MSTPANEAFEAWWEADGQFIDPDTDDVPWFDKRKGLAEYAFRAAMETTQDGRLLRTLLDLALLSMANCIDKVNERHENNEAPWKYGTPYDAINKLSATKKAITDQLGGLPQPTKGGDAP